MSDFLGEDIRPILASLRNGLLLEIEVLTPPESAVCNNLITVFPHYDGTSLAAVVALHARMLGVRDESLADACTNFLLDESQSLVNNFMLPSADYLADFDFTEDDRHAGDTCGNATNDSDSKERLALKPLQPPDVPELLSSSAAQSVSFSHQPFEASRQSVPSEGTIHSSASTLQSNSSSTGPSPTSSLSRLLSGNSNHHSVPNPRSLQPEVTRGQPVSSSPSNTSLQSSTAGSSILLSSGTGSASSPKFEAYQQTVLAEDSSCHLLSTSGSNISSLKSSPTRTPSILLSSSSEHQPGACQQPSPAKDIACKSVSLSLSAPSSSTTSLGSSPAILYDAGNSDHQTSPVSGAPTPSPVRAILDHFWGDVDLLPDPLISSESSAPSSKSVPSLQTECDADNKWTSLAGGGGSSSIKAESASSIAGMSREHSSSMCMVPGCSDSAASPRHENRNGTASHPVPSTADASHSNKPFGSVDHGIKETVDMISQSSMVPKTSPESKESMDSQSSTVKLSPVLDVDESSGDSLPDLDLLLKKTDSELYAEKSHAENLPDLWGDRLSLVSLSQRSDSQNSASSDLGDLPDLDFLSTNPDKQNTSCKLEKDESPITGVAEAAFMCTGESMLLPAVSQTTSDYSQAGSERKADTKVTYSSTAQRNDVTEATRQKLMMKLERQANVGMETGWKRSPVGRKKWRFRKMSSPSSGIEDIPASDQILPLISAPKRKHDKGLSPMKSHSSPSLSARGHLSSPVASHNTDRMIDSVPLGSPNFVTSGSVTYLGKAGSGSWKKSSQSAGSVGVGRCPTAQKSSTSLSPLCSTSGVSPHVQSLASYVGRLDGCMNSSFSTFPSSSSSTTNPMQKAVSDTAVPAVSRGPNSGSALPSVRSPPAIAGRKPVDRPASSASATLTSGPADTRSDIAKEKDRLASQILAGHPYQNPFLANVFPSSFHAIHQLVAPKPSSMVGERLTGCGASDGASLLSRPPLYGPLLRAPDFPPWAKEPYPRMTWPVPLHPTVLPVARGPTFLSQSGAGLLTTCSTATPAVSSCTASWQINPLPSQPSHVQPKSASDPSSSKGKGKANSTPPAKPSLSPTTASSSSTSAPSTSGSTAGMGAKTGLIKAYSEPVLRSGTGRNQAGKSSVPVGRKQVSGGAGEDVEVMPMDVDDAANAPIILDDTFDSQGDVEIVDAFPSKSIIIEDDDPMQKGGIANPGPSTSAAHTHLPQPSTSSAAFSCVSGSAAGAGSSGGSPCQRSSAPAGDSAIPEFSGSSMSSRHPGLDIGVRSVLEIFPDACPRYVCDTLEGFLFANGLDYALSRTMDHLLDNPTFPRRHAGHSDVAEPIGPQRPQAPPVTVVHITKPAAPSVDSKDYFKEYDGLVNSQAANQALDKLSMDFPMLNRSTLSAVLAQYRHHYAPASHSLEEAMAEFKKEHAKRKAEQENKTTKGSLKTPKKPDSITVICHKGQQCERRFQMTLMRKARDKLPGGRTLPEVYEPSLQCEIDFVTRHFQESDRQMAWSLLETEYEEQGQMIECNCCFAEHPFENLVQCFDGHLFCCQCLIGYAKEAIYGSGKLNLPCMADGCDIGFPKNQLIKALPPDMMEKYDERVAEESLNLAAMPDLVRCPKCSIAAVLDPGIKVFKCPNADCRKETCRDCKEDWAEHVGKTCDQLEKKDETKLRTLYEEKMTRAKIRTCPNCQAQFFKDEGCNKMTCRCGTTMCYICRKSQISYKHFCQHPRDPGKGCDKCTACSLWTNPEEDEKRAIQEMQREAQEKRKEQGYLDDRVVGVPDPAEPPAKKKRK